MPETCWESVDNKHLTLASCWFSLSLHDLLTMHGYRNLKPEELDSVFGLSLYILLLLLLLLLDESTVSDLKEYVEYLYCCQ